MAKLLPHWLNQPVINPFHRSKADELSPTEETHQSGQVGESDVQTMLPQKYIHRDVKVSEDADDNAVTSSFQLGVRKAEAVTLTWSPTALYCTYA